MMMKQLSHIILVAFAMFALNSCQKKEQKTRVEEPKTEEISLDENEDDSEDLESSEAEEAKAGVTKEEVEVVNPGDFSKLKRYNVVVASLAKQAGVARLSRDFDKYGIKFFTVRNPNGLTHFIIHSSDSLENAITIRRKFLSDNAIGKTRLEIWKKFDIKVTDAYILKKN